MRIWQQTAALAAGREPASLKHPESEPCHSALLKINPGAPSALVPALAASGLGVPTLVCPLGGEPAVAVRDFRVRGEGGGVRGHVGIQMVSTCTVRYNSEVMKGVFSLLSYFTDTLMPTGISRCCSTYCNVYSEYI